MRDLLALRGVGIIVALFVAVLVVIWTLVSLGFTTFLVPPPEMTAEQFLRALKAHRYEAARDQLSEEIQQQVTADDLRALVRTIEERHGGLNNVDGQGARIADDRAVATVVVTLGDGTAETLEFPLTKEQGLWKVASVEPVQRLATGRADTAASTETRR